MWYEGLFFFGHFFITNLNCFFFKVYIIFFMFFCSLFYFYAAKGIKINVLFCILNLILFSDFIFFVNSFFSFFFCLEILSILVYYKFLSSKLWDASEQTQKLKNFFFFDMLFFQFWVMFFSSVFFLFFLLVYLYYFGSLDWYMLNYLNIFFKNFILYKNVNFLKLISFFFFFIFLLKIGFLPFHFYKIEMYKGFSYFLIACYSFIFFFVYLVFFFFLISFLLYSFFSDWLSYTTVILCFGVYFILIFLFDINYLKSFFGYSSVLNVFFFLFFFLIVSNV